MMKFCCRAKDLYQLDILNDLVKSKGYTSKSSLFDSHYFHYPFLSNYGCLYDVIKPNYKEVSFTEFVDHINNFSELDDFFCETTRLRLFNTNFKTNR